MVLARAGTRPSQRQGGRDGTLAHRDRHPHQVPELRLDQAEVDDVAAALAEGDR
jgi:hypothetical protein